jgi:hypothetical protein
MAQAWSVFVIPAAGAAAGILIAAAEVFYYNKVFVGERKMGRLACMCVGCKTTRF